MSKATFGPVENPWKPGEDSRIERILLLVGKMLEKRGVTDFRQLWDVVSYRVHAEGDLKSGYYVQRLNGVITDEQFDECKRFIDSGELHKLYDYLEIPDERTS